MSSKFWLQRWKEQRIGWHQPRGHRHLRQYWRARGRRVLVPLCGKSVDMLWLQSMGNEVVGVELSDIAARAFFEENEIPYRVEEGESRRFVAEDREISIICDDYFNVSVPQFDAYYDRAAMVAVEPSMRLKYVQHTRGLLAPDPYLFIITLEYDQALVGGPPFSVPAQAFRSYFPGLTRRETREDIETYPPRFREAGLKDIVDVIWTSP